MRFFALMPVRNEAKRYLTSHLLWHSWMFDGIAVYDDASIDTTRIIAEKNGADVGRRPGSVPTFIEHEGQFRQAAYDYLVETYQPTTDDWILALDADEFVVAEGAETHQMIRLAIAASEAGHTAIPIKIPEVFDLGDRDDPQIPLIRKDGFWPGLTQPRLFRYQTAGRYKDLKMGSGAVPTYALENVAPSQDDLFLLHYGYAFPRDREEKYERYKNLSGHNPKHVESIRSKPRLEAWSGKIPEVERGDF